MISGVPRVRRKLSSAATRTASRSVKCSRGPGNVPFTYRIVTKRKDIDGRRFAASTIR